MMTPSTPPSPPRLIEQRACPSNAEDRRFGSQPVLTNDLEDLLSWDYLVTYADPYHYRQDRTYVHIEFNVAPIEVGGTVGVASSSEHVEEVCVDLKRGESNVYEFFIEENEKSAEDSCTGTPAGVPDGVLCLHLVGKPPASLKLTEPLNVEIAGWTANRVEVEDGYVFTYSQTNPESADTVTTYLDAGDGAVIGERRIVLPRLYILDKQNAWISVYRIRNDPLPPLDQSDTAEPFVYATDEVRFPNPCCPLLDSDEVILLECIGGTKPQTGGGCRDPQTAPLGEHLSALCCALFKSDGQARPPLAIDVAYEYSLQRDIRNPDTLPIRVSVPLFLLDKFSAIEDSGGGAASADSVFRDLATVLKDWLTLAKPNGYAGKLGFDLTIFSDLTEQNVPLLRLRRIELPLKCVSDL